MRRTNSTGLRLDLTENTPDSSLNTSRLPNLVVEHAEAVGSNCHQHTLGENLNSKLPNVVEGSMDYGSERRSSRYLADYDTSNAAAAVAAGIPVKSIYHQDAAGMPSSSLNYGVAESGYLERGYHTVRGGGTYDRKTASFDRDNLERYDNRIYPEEGSLRYERGRIECTYQESDLDAPYERSDSSKIGKTYNTDHVQDASRRYSRDMSEYDYARYAEETLKLESKKPNTKVTYELPTTKGYESGVKTNNHDQAYDLAGQKDSISRGYDANGKYHSAGGKMYGTLPRYEAAGAKYDSEYERGAASNLSAGLGSGYETSTGRAKVYEGIKYELTTSKSYERAKYESSAGSSRYGGSADGTSKSYEQTLKIGESPSGTLGGYSRKNPDNVEGGCNAQEKMNGYRKNNFEAYGVYSDPEDDHGFLSDKKTTPQYTYKGVVVNASGESSVIDQKRAKEAGHTNMSGSPWCRPTVLMLLLVLLVVIFVLIAGILLYFNYMSYKPRHPIIEGKDLNYASNNAEPCEKTFCALGMSCVVSENGQAMCQCPAACPESHNPVCGNDGVTYANHCQLRRTSCQKRKDTRFKHQGPCGESSRRPLLAFVALLAGGG
ncbi:PREDICTED: uncharacterized protein LOC105363687 [Ceratosolen solmsi marchali]|uniref:Uncharacterized protein LOC105363687 n=1 Tax=Ceratosolen solmsi marchali TaxID=326594 RepID=A0AAJ7DX82_9HYME|nr:PREDICTED: uncharacterized protein LOC105363687 [Ceratosolen solmsi marchali]